MILPGDYVRVKNSDPVRVGRVVKFIGEPPQERCMLDVGDCNPCYNQSDLEKLSDRDVIKELREALCFYADPESYFAIGFLPDSPCGEFIEDFSEVEEAYIGKTVRPGKLAREVILRYKALWKEMKI